MGSTLQNVGLMTFVSYHLVKSGINRTLNMGHVASGNCKNCGHIFLFCRKGARPCSECITDLVWSQMVLWSFETSDVIWSPKSTLVYTLNPELMCRSIVTDVLMYRLTKVTIYLGFAFVVTIFDIFNLIIDYQVDNQI